MSINKNGQDSSHKPTVVGWREWCALPDLAIPAIKAKIDTGARTSAIHAFDITPFDRDDSQWLNFKLHPLQGNDELIVSCEAKMTDQRDVMSSSGHKELRYVIQTSLQLGDQQWNIELTLSNRDPMRFRILLGREALAEKVTVDPSHSLITKQYDHQQLLNLYK